jgi:hypothetical protein
MELLKKESDPKRQQQLGEFISSYLTRVEHIKAIIKAEQEEIKKGTRNYHVTPKAVPPPAATSRGAAKSKFLHIEDLINEALGNGVSRSAGGNEKGKHISGGSSSGPSDGISGSSGGGTVTSSSSSASPLVTAASLSEYEKSIMGDMLDSSPGVTWDDIAGQICVLVCDCVRSLGVTL